MSVLIILASISMTRHWIEQTVLLLTFPSSHLLEIFRDVKVSENNIAECHLFCNKHLNDIITYINEYFAITITNT